MLVAVTQGCACVMGLPSATTMQRASSEHLGSRRPTFRADLSTGYSEEPSSAHRAARISHAA